MGLGTWKITDAKKMDTAVDAAIASGYRLFDTAVSYNNDKVLGAALQRHINAGTVTRKELYITTKIDPTASNRIPTILNDTLQHLGIGDYVDMLLIHSPPWTATGRKDMWQAFEALQSQGKALSIGVSNYNQDQMEEMRNYSKSWPITLNQVEFSPRVNKDELLEYMRLNGIFLQVCL